MNIDQAEVQLAAYLAGKVNSLNIDAVPIPETQAEFEKPVTRDLVTVMFVSEKADPNNALGTVAQRVTVQFGFMVQGRKLRGPNGVHQLADIVKRCMTGYRLPDAEQMYYVGHDFVNFKDNEWEHRVLFECKSMRVDGQDYIPDPLLKRVDFDEV